MNKQYEQTLEQIYEDIVDKTMAISGYMDNSKKVFNRRTKYNRHSITSVCRKSLEIYLELIDNDKEKLLELIATYIIYVEDLTYYAFNDNYYTIIELIEEHGIDLLLEKIIDPIKYDIKKYCEKYNIITLDSLEQGLSKDSMKIECYYQTHEGLRNWCKAVGLDYEKIKEKI